MQAIWQHISGCWGNGSLPLPHPPSACSFACMWAAHSRRQMLMNFNPLDFSNGLNLKSLNILLNAAVSNTYILVTMIYSWKEKKKKQKTVKIKHLKINLCCKWIGYKHFGLLSPTASVPCPVLGHVPLAAVTKNVGTQCPPPTCKPSMANLRIDGVSLEACLKEKLLQSIIRMKPFIWSSWSSMSTSKDSRIARRISMKEFLKTKHKKKRKKNRTKSMVAVIFKPPDSQLCCRWGMCEGRKINLFLLEFFLKRKLFQRCY